MTEDSMHRTLDAALARNSGPSAEDVALVPQFYRLDLFEHYQEDGYLIVATTDASAIRLEPGDFIVKRLWSTAVKPYIYNRAARVEGGA